MKKLLCLTAICLLMTVLPVSAAANDMISVANESSFSNALDTVVDGGTITVDGTISLPAGFKWNAHNKTVTITGGTLDFSELTDVFLGNGVNFENITLKFADSSSFYANGNHLLIAESVTVAGQITIYGGGKYSTPDSTDMTLLSGTYTDIFGGSYFGGVNGDVKLIVGGNVNADLAELTHSHTNCVYGGCNNGKVSGKVNLTFTGNARANYVYGGALGQTSRITGGIDLHFAGGEATSICGGSRDTDHKGDVHLTVTGGSAEQIFGGCEHAALTGNVYVNVLGGTINRRIYGGCYNEVSSTGKWSSANYVTGKIVLTIGQSANITFRSSDSDRSLYAHSRQKTLSDKEETHLVFADSAAHDKYKDIVGAQDWIMKLLMAGVNAADSTHYFTYSASGSTITQRCSYHSVAGTLTLSAKGAVYTGDPIRSAQITLSDSWVGAAPDITYENNSNAGTATAAVTVGNASASVSFTIANASQSAPAVTAVNETINGKADGRITGLTTQMQISTDGSTYSPVTDPNMAFQPGTYYVRFPAKTNYNASSPTIVTISQGRMLKVTFRAEGAADILREAAWNTTLTDIPAVPAKSGYTGIWDHDGGTITEDMTINAIYEPVSLGETQETSTTQSTTAETPPPGPTAPDPSLPENTNEPTETTSPEPDTGAPTVSGPDPSTGATQDTVPQTAPDNTENNSKPDNLKTILILIPILLIIAGGICAFILYKKKH